MRTNHYKGFIMNGRNDNAVVNGFVYAYGGLIVAGVIVNRVRDRKLSKAGRRLKSLLSAQQRIDAAMIRRNIHNGTYTKAQMDQLAADCEFSAIVVEEV